MILEKMIFIQAVNIRHTKIRCVNPRLQATLTLHFLKIWNLKINL
jgi:hypothetical protein